MMTSTDIEETVRRALAEDVGGGDVSARLIPENTKASAELITREAGVLCGQAWFDEVFRQIDPAIRGDWQARDGQTVHPGQLLCRLTGPARGLLTGERCALNFLQILSGTASCVARYVEALRGTNAVLLDTRKTLPGLRAAQKYAVRCGGGQNHRMGLYDAVLIKENHITAAGSIEAVLRAAQTTAPAGMPIVIEVENLDGLRAALAAGAQRLLLDNFDLEMLKDAVRETHGRATLEASGGATLDNIRAIAETGVNFVSVGSLTKHVHALDLSLRFLHP